MNLPMGLWLFHCSIAQRSIIDLKVNVYCCTTTQTNSSRVMSQNTILKIFILDELLDNYIQFYHHALKQELINVCMHHC